MAFITSTAVTVFGSANADTINTQAPNGSFSTIYGGLGNDIYFIDAFYVDLIAGNTPQDVVIEAVGGGIDTIHLDLYYDLNSTTGSTSFTLSENVENLEASLYSYTGTNYFTLTGNSLARLSGVTA